jgi:hypothetical protein
MYEKDGSVNIKNLCPEILSKLDDLNALYKKFTGHPLVITSGNDSTEHMKTSLHYEDRAIDTRTSNWILSLNKLIDFFLAICILFPDTLFDILYEGDHLHIEYDPKG